MTLFKAVESVPIAALSGVDELFASSCRSIEIVRTHTIIPVPYVHWHYTMFREI